MCNRVKSILELKMKKDKYLRARGGTAKLLNICCCSCDSIVIKYQKDGIGYLHRCYLNRIEAPEKYAKLKNDSSLSKSNDLPKLTCQCGEVIGIPMKHSDGRLAFRLERGKYKRILDK